MIIRSHFGSRPLNCCTTTPLPTTHFKLGFGMCNAWGLYSLAPLSG